MTAVVTLFSRPLIIIIIIFPIGVNIAIIATADLADFINAACKIWAKQRLGHETQIAETETSASRD